MAEFVETASKSGAVTWADMEIRNGYLKYADFSQSGIRSERREEDVRDPLPVRWPVDLEAYSLLQVEYDCHQYT